MLKRILFVAMILISSRVMAQETMKELSVSYLETVKKKDTMRMNIDMFHNTVQHVYIKGKDYRIEQSFAGGSQGTIYNSATNSSVLLRSFGDRKKLIRIPESSLKIANSEYDTVNYVIGTETKTIAGYLCKQATAHMKSGNIITIFYTTDIVCGNKNFDPMFIRLDGFPLLFSIETNRFTISYEATAVKLEPVPADKFKIPAGYTE